VRKHPGTGKYVRVEARPPDEDIAAGAQALIPGLAGPFSNDEMDTMVQGFTVENWNDDAKLSTRALCKRFVKGPEGETVMSVSVQDWSEDNPYPSEPHNTVTCRQLKERALAAWEADYHFGRGVGAFQDQGAFSDETIQPETRSLRPTRGF
jgi:hypothetical protein